MNGLLGRRRRLIISAMCACAGVVVGLLWWFETRAGLISPFDRYGYPFLLALFVGGMITIVKAPRYRGHAEGIVYTGASLYFIAALFSFTVIQADNRIYTVANTLQWMPIMYVAAFVLFRHRVAIIMSAGIFVLAMLPSVVILALYGTGYWDMTIAGLLINAYTAHTLILIALSLVAVLDREYERTALLARSMETAALTDGLTGIANRRGLDQMFTGLSQQPGVMVGLILVDVDHFKRVNDIYGHLVGDELLIFLVRHINEQLGPTDVLGRWGGEELLVVSVGVGYDATLQLAERIRAVIFASAHPVAGRITVSAGVTVWTSGTPIADALRQADKAMYCAKTLGRDRVEAL
jgi:diguanylate cyclase (GGDEF)-like protein